MQVFIVTDIFGRTDEIDWLERTICQQGANVAVIDPYQGKQQIFSDEAQAYQTFLQSCGHRQYSLQIKTAITTANDDVVILGFSVGAFAAWLAVDRLVNDNLRHLVGFYPSQIRKSLAVMPGCPVTLLFPKSEQHFEVGAVITQLDKIAQVSTYSTDFYHGFMNPLSVNYSSLAVDGFRPIISDLDNLAEVPRLQALINACTAVQQTK